ncbi:transporter substrate-binding domain-containing protein [Herbaspirillum sp. VT-16-41]|uniref:transporter substrate-binding domain-containing protein n=1 Tax=Herbaspirillum sp. VT-16-41 TaxID=1953765 RepID=UPI00143DC4AC|nr:transporter substrate-binding domain-containing protein [Herbaspirillum sp. VT-16-41]
MENTLRRSLQRLLRLPTLTLTLILGLAAGTVLMLPMPLAQAAADDSLSRLQQAGVVRIANTQTSPPWSYLDDKNQPDGYDVAVAREIFRRIGVARIEFIADKFKNFVEGINARKYDVVVNSMARTPEREKVVDFTLPYTVQDFRIWVNASNTDIRDRASLKGKSVGASAGTANEMWAHKNLPDSQVRAYEGGGFLYNDLVSGRLDSVIDSYFNGYKMKTINNLPVKTVGAPLVYSLGAAVLPKHADALKAAMDKAITDMIADGTLQKIAQRYVSPDYDMVGNMKKAIDH